jgi:hypothetical protein
VCKALRNDNVAPYQLQQLLAVLASLIPAAALAYARIDYTHHHHHHHQIVSPALGRQFKSSQLIYIKHLFTLS